MSMITKTHWSSKQPNRPSEQNTCFTDTAEKLHCLMTSRCVSGHACKADLSFKAKLLQHSFCDIHYSRIQQWELTVKINLPFHVCTPHCQDQPLKLLMTKVSNKSKLRLSCRYISFCYNTASITAGIKVFRLYSNSLHLPQQPIALRHFGCLSL